MIRGIIFDCFGVLYHGSLDYLRELAPPDRVGEVTDLSHSYDYGYITQVDYFRGVGEVIGKTADEVRQICKEQHVRNEVLVGYVRTLRPAYKTALLSNVGRGFVESLFTAEELKELFDAEVLSNEVGMAKPNVGIYQLTADRLGLSPRQCVMIDDIDRNVQGARAAGMRGILYQNMKQFQRELAALTEGDDA
ncbi:HAD-IA family hydrolase [Streptomyces caniscabiei]|uniref:HAD-IA family hydrolase n=1 Tax=Streptomyces caniscabiei TaxID=2746961 RepID=UPI0029B212EF|nr:HAD-IA family hydrolase [Streptomyces caniscabiei]MDX2776335.1 HAD-IA family hydrolase [Streptomyces caniscabiei]